MKTEKTHYRNVFKSDHLSIYDLEDLEEKGMQLIFTIKEVRQQIGVSVAGRKGDFNIAYFNENIKPLVLNAVNGKKIAGFTKSGFVQDWVNVPVELYIKRDVKLKGEIVGGIRIKSEQPVIKTKDEVIAIINSATNTNTLNEWRVEISKHDLMQLAIAKSKELKRVAND